MMMMSSHRRVVATTGDIAFVRAWNGVMTTAQMQAEWTAFHARVGF